MSKTIYLIFVLTSFLCFKSVAQMEYKTVQLNRIEQKKIREYLEERRTVEIPALLNVKPSFTKKSNPTNYRHLEKHFKYEGNVNEVWNHYLHSNPATVWDARKVSFGMLFSKADEAVCYRGDVVENVELGQVYYLNLRILLGVKNIALAFEVTKIDATNKQVEFCYLEGNISEGRQDLYFKEDKGQTVIVHCSDFKSNSKFRDRILYPYFHNRMIKEFHRNMHRSMKTQQKLAENN